MDTICRRWYTVGMRNIIHFSIEEGQDGYYVASALNYAIITQAKTLEDLFKNIREATELHLEDTSVEEPTIGKSPSILINYELPLSAHA